MIKKFLLLLLIISPPVFAEWQMKEARMMTKWAKEVDVNAPLPEYPRPQMVRSDWMNLNGLWQFQSGKLDDRIPFNKDLEKQILVPFAMESAISGIMEHHDRAWYRRTFDVPPKWAGKSIILHLDAVDFESEIYINGQSVTVHKGGYDPIILDITSYLKKSGPQEMIVRVFDPTDAAGYARGKQTLTPGGIMYRSVTGIWQSVWLEPVDATGIKNLKMTPDIDSSSLNVRVNTYIPAGQKAKFVVKSNGEVVTSFSGEADKDLAIKIPKQQLWSPDNPFLYDLEVRLEENNQEVDFVKSYFGMRKIALGREDGVLKMFLNNEFVFQMGPLDQGWWPDGLYTAPTDEALKYDIVKTKEFGFNMTRKHIKVEPARWYYWADKLGLLVWQDMPSINSYTHDHKTIDAPQFELELNRMIENLWNYPSIVSWVVFNERQGRHDVEHLVKMTQAKDPSRLVNQDSGGGSEVTQFGDVHDLHNYPPPVCPNPDDTMALACGEYGGIGFIYKGRVWDPTRDIMEYQSVESEEDFFDRYYQYSKSLLEFKVKQGMSAAVYTEITDVENETNGLMTYDRIVKVDIDRVAAINKMAIDADVRIETVLPNASLKPAEWAYTTSKPAANWNKPGFDTSSWKTGKGGFGTVETPNAKVGTPWNSSDIWIRREFKMDKYSTEDIALMCLKIFYDEDYELYINGVLAGSNQGYTANYIAEPMTDAGKAALKPGKTNTIAIHCRQTRGGQFIDAGIQIYEIINN